MSLYRYADQVSRAYGIASGPEQHGGKFFFLRIFVAKELQHAGAHRAFGREVGKTLVDLERGIQRQLDTPFANACRLCCRHLNLLDGASNILRDLGDLLRARSPATARRNDGPGEEQGDLDAQPKSPTAWADEEHAELQPLGVKLW
jgi:hypothetical protein